MLHEHVYESEDDYSTLADNISLMSEREQVSLSHQNSTQYSDRSLQCYSLM